MGGTDNYQEFLRLDEVVNNGRNQKTFQQPLATIRCKTDLDVKIKFKILIINE